MAKNIVQFGPLFIIIAALLWSFDGVLRIGLYSLSPSVVVFYEHVLGALLLLPFFFKWVPELKLLSKKEWLGIILVALFSGALGTIFYTAALAKIQYISYSVVVLLQQQLQPIWAIGAAAFVLKEKVSRSFIGWAFVALIAAYLITFKDLTVNIQTGSETIVAALFALFAGFLWGTSTALSKYVLRKVSFVTATTLRFYLAPLFALVFIFATNSSHQLVTLTFSQWISLLIITLSTGLIALLIYYYGLKKTPARVATICELVWPASAVLIDYFYFGRLFSVTQLFGMALLLLAIYHVSQYKK